MADIKEKLVEIKKVLVLHYQYVCRRADYITGWMPIALPEPAKGDAL